MNPGGADDASDADGINWLTAEDVRAIHDAILYPGNIAGEDGARPIESSLARAEQRVHYGVLPIDVLRIAIAYIMSVAKTHALIDGNKRTATIGAMVFLARHGYQLTGVDPTDLADAIEAIAGDRMDERELYDWLRPYLETIGDDPTGVVTIDGDDPPR